MRPVPNGCAHLAPSGIAIILAHPDPDLQALARTLARAHLVRERIAYEVVVWAHDVVTALAGHLLWDDRDIWTYRFPNQHEARVDLVADSGVPVRYVVESTSADDRSGCLTEPEMIHMLVQVALRPKRSR